MNRIIFLLTFGLSLVIFSCKHNVPSIINGRLTNIEDTTISLYIGKDPITGLEPVDYQKVYNISKEGTFSIPIETSYPVSILLQSENYNFFARVILIKGGDLSLTADCSDSKETLEYQGTNSGINTFYFEWNKFDSNADREIRAYIDSYSIYKNSLDSLQTISLKMLDDFRSEEHLTKDELLWLTSEIIYGKYFYLTTRAYQLNAQPNDSSYQFFHTLNLNDQDASLISQKYNESILRYILYELHTSGIYYSDFDDNRDFFNAFYDSINEKLKDKVRDAILTTFISSLLDSYNVLTAEYYEKYLTDCSSPEMVEKTSNLYKDYLKVVNESLNDSVNLISTNHQRPMKVLSQFENKVIYMDFWASWCSPCIRGLPHTRQLAEHYKNQELVVLYIGSNDQESSLINAIKKHHLVGNHIILNEEESETWREEFDIRGIPTYVLVDKEGNVVNLNAPHQNTDEAYVLIDSLLSAH